MKTYWAIGAALLIAAPIMALPSGRADKPDGQQVVVDAHKGDVDRKADALLGKISKSF